MAFFTSAGYVFNSYSYTLLNNSDINNVTYNSELNLTEVTVNGKIYFFDEKLKSQFDKNLSELIAYENSPAIRNKLKGAIIQADDVKIKNIDDLQIFLQNKNPGDNISLKLRVSEIEIKDYYIALGKHPNNSSLGYIGVSSTDIKPTGIFSTLLYYATLFKSPATYYEPIFASELIIFIEKLLWWIILLNLSVAVMNMLPVSIFDGGQVFYVTMLKIFKKENIARGLVSFVSFFILCVFLFMTFLWFWQTF